MLQVHNYEPSQKLQQKKQIDNSEQLSVKQSAEQEPEEQTVQKPKERTEKQPEEQITQKPKEQTDPKPKEQTEQKPKEQTVQTFKEQTELKAKEQTEPPKQQREQKLPDKTLELYIRRLEVKTSPQQQDTLSNYSSGSSIESLKRRLSESSEDRPSSKQRRLCFPEVGKDKSVRHLKLLATNMRARVISNWPFSSSIMLSIKKI